MSLVILGREVIPQFPNRCPVCDQEAPGGRLIVSTLPFEARPPAWMKSRWPFIVLEMPGCDICHRQLRATIYRRRIAFLGTVAAAFIYREQVPWVREYPKSWVLIAFMVPFLTWEMIRPRPFHFSVGKSDISYGFENAAYAEDFAALNGTEVSPGE